MVNLFEFQNKTELSDSLYGLEEFLEEIWGKREKTPNFYDEDIEVRTETQRFLQFLHKTKEIKSNKYVGVIHFKGKRINLLPKIFFDSEKEYSTNEIYQIQNHILWWLSYCRKIKFPSYQCSLGHVKSDFFEVLIYLFSKYTRQLLSNSIYRQYEELNREINFIKGKLQTDKYITQNIVTGRWHKFNCTFDAFVIDNKFNRIIKYVTTLLFNVTSNFDNKKALREILFILDEVTDVRVTAEECSAIRFNPVFSEFETVRDYCYLFLSNCISFDYKNELKLFAFLLPMEYVFEDFVFGFINKELELVSAESQISSKYLDLSETFLLRPDLVLRTSHKSLIADTKYKIVYSDARDPKKGISQSDLYQALAYAVRFNIDEIILFYPNTLLNYQEQSSEITIEDALALNKKVIIKSYQLPIIDNLLLSQDFNSDQDINKQFQGLKRKLTERLENILLL